ncbi:hypothetical protein J4052_09185 [Bacillus toyonensis]|nr:hypothetical protein [Bacillus toyonensis]
MNRRNFGCNDSSELTQPPLPIVIQPPMNQSPIDQPLMYQPPMNLSDSPMDQPPMNKPPLEYCPVCDCDEELNRSKKHFKHPKKRP